MLAKILVVDDSATDRLIIQNMLAGYTVLFACDGLEAMRAIESNEDIELIILDLNMPNMDGFQVLRTLQSDERYRKLRTIILTNYDELENEIKGLHLGAVDYIRKPIHMESLRARMEIHIGLLRVQNAVEQRMHEQGLTYDMIFSQAPIGIAISYSKEVLCPGESQYFSVNPAFERITGRLKEELLDLGWAAITHPDDLEEESRNYEKLRSGEIDGYTMDKRFIKPDGSIVWVHMVGAPLVMSEGHRFNHISLVQDITERKVIEQVLMESERSKAMLLSNLPGMAYRCSFDRDWTMQFVSSGCYELTGYAPESIVNSRDLSFNDLITPKYRELLWQEWRYILPNHKPFRFEYEITTAGGEQKWVLEIGQGVYTPQGEVEALEGIIIDISDRKRAESILAYNSEHDEWTGLYNRRYLTALLEKDIAASPDQPKALVGINLSMLQSLSLTYGFGYSQDLTKKIAAALTVYCCDRCLLINTYEYRFVFYLKAYEGRDALSAFCDAVSATVDAMLTVERVHAGIGVLELSEINGDDPDFILKKLLITTEEAVKLDDEKHICFFDGKMEERITRKEIIERELAQIIAGEKAEGFYLQYQPIYDLRTNRISGFEALARLKSEKLGPVPPLEFIPLAEETRHIIALGDRIITQACDFINRLQKIGHGDLFVSINVSALQLPNKNFVSNLLKTIADKNVDPRCIVLELTESIFSSKFEYINRILGELSTYGIQSSIDDFGTGYSSFSRERELNVNCLKIDKAFIDKLLFLKPEETITGDIISMAHRLGHSVVAEGVEYEEQLKYLKDHGCDKIQGYLISRPLNEDAALDLLGK